VSLHHTFDLRRVPTIPRLTHRPYLPPTPDTTADDYVSSAGGGHTYDARSAIMHALPHHHNNLLHNPQQQQQQQQQSYAPLQSTQDTRRSSTGWGEYPLYAPWGAPQVGMSSSMGAGAGSGMHYTYPLATSAPLPPPFLPPLGGQGGQEGYENVGEGWEEVMREELGGVGLELELRWGSLGERGGGIDQG
jgi:hypothetical protein